MAAAADLSDISVFAVTGIDTTGTTSAYTEVKAAWDACIAAGGGVVQLPAGIISLSHASGKALILPQASGGATPPQVTLRGQGKGATKVKLGSAFRTLVLVDTAGSGADRTAGNLTIEDLTVDNNSVTTLNFGEYGVVFGASANINYRNIVIRRVDTLNLGAQVASGTKERRSVDVTVSQTTVFDPAAPELVGDNIRVESCRFGLSGGGGNMGPSSRGTRSR